MTETRACRTCGRLQARAECTRCQWRRRHGVVTDGRPICTEPGCGNIAQANDGQHCGLHFDVNSRACGDCGRPARWGYCPRCTSRRRLSVATDGKPTCVMPECDNIAQANHGRMCARHAIPALLTHSEPGPLDTPCEILDGHGRGAGDYGRVRLGARMLGSHQWVWEVYNGSIPDGLWVLHDCDRAGCVALHHLHLGTASDNSTEMWARGRRRSGSSVEEVGL